MSFRSPAKFITILFHIVVIITFIDTFYSISFHLKQVYQLFSSNHYYFNILRQCHGEKLLLFPILPVVEGHKHELMFPSNDDYDPMAFHPDTAIAFGSGAPYGGYSRASRSRLAKLPIRLVGDAQFDIVNEGRSTELTTNYNDNTSSENDAMKEGEENPNEEEKEEEAGEYYFHIRDGEGRLFACAVHHEDDVHPQSLEDSVFDDVIMSGEEPPQSTSIGSTTNEDKNKLSQGSKVKKDSSKSTNDNDMADITKLVNDVISGNNNDGVIGTTVNIGDIIGVVAGGQNNIDDNNNDVGTMVADMIRDALANEGIVGDEIEGVQIDIQQLDVDLEEGEDGVGGADNQDVANMIANALRQAAGQRGGGGGGLGRAAVVGTAGVGGRRGGQHHHQQQGGGAGGGAGAGGVFIGGQGGNIMGGSAFNVGINMKEVERISQQLQGVCAQVHQGYWSYEWCHKKAMKQFHVKAEAKKDQPGQFHYTIDSVIRFGKYQSESPKMLFKEFHFGNGALSSSTTTTTNTNGQDGTSKKSKLDWASVTLHQTYENGDKCAEAGGKRRSVATELRCCTKEEQVELDNEDSDEGDEKDTSNENFGGSSTSSSSKSKKLARLIKVEEHKTQLCTYTATVCTPLLCSEDVIHMEGENNLKNKQQQAQEQSSSSSSSNNDNAAVTEMLKKFGMNDIASAINEALSDATVASSSSSSTVGAGRPSTLSSSSSVIPATAMFDSNQSIRKLLISILGNKCLQKNDGWWRYEICHTKRVRQFHAGTKIDPMTGNTQMFVETEHLLGLYNHTVVDSSNSSDNAQKKKKQNKQDNDDEDDDITSALDYPDSEEIKHMENPKSSLATFTMEYTGGDMCDNSDDVKDESLKRVARATTVKFSCGKTYELKRVNEDSTCHYVFHVSVPDLCRHPLFVAPVVKEQIVKCLPVVYDMLLDDE